MSYQEFRPMRWQILPPVVKNLLIINGIMFLATVVFENKFGFDLGEYLGLRYPTSQYFQPYQFVTHLFMHGSFTHILSNMFALWMFGNVLENVWGGKRFLIYYMVTGLGAAVIHTGFTYYEISQMQKAVDLFAVQGGYVDFRTLIDHYSSYINYQEYQRIGDFLTQWKSLPNDPRLKQEAVSFAHVLLERKADVPVVGASGAVFGVLLAFGMMFPNTLIYLYFFFPMKAKWFVMLYGAFELYSGLQSNPGDNVAHFAHLGGMLFGFILIRLWNKRRYHPFRDEY